MSLINWREWDEASFALARAEDKPVLLDIGAVWCHWCHVMDDGIPGDPNHRGTYSDPEIAEIIHERFVPIKVDNDRRPDINARYNMGGWPSTVFLTPEGEPLYGETYVPPDRMLSLLPTIAEYYRDKKEEINVNLARRAGAGPEPVIIEGAGPTTSVDLGAAVVPGDAPARVADMIASNFDSVYGGFGSQPKFPHPDALAFCIDRYRLSGDHRMRQIAEATLDAMSGGGMYDPYADGFFRYSTTRDWSIPHYEKMLHDNALLSGACLQAGNAFDEPRFTQVALDVHRWLFEVMRSPETLCFAGSQDADEEERYYGKPLDERAKMETPYIDWTVYVDWNARLVSSLALRYKLLDEDDILVAAKAANSFLRDKVGDSHFWADGLAQGPKNLLTDKVALLDSAVDLHEIAGDPAYLKDAVGIADSMLALLRDSTGAFLDMPYVEGAIGALREPRVDLNANADAALALTRLSIVTSDHRYRAAAEATVAVFAGSYHRHSYQAASYGRAVSALTAPTVKVVLVGDTSSEALADLRRAAWLSAPAYAATITVNAASTIDYPASPDGSPRAYVCVGERCLAPVATVEELNEALAGIRQGA